jgi:hypothetical protein
LGTAPVYPAGAPSLLPSPLDRGRP